LSDVVGSRKLVDTLRNWASQWETGVPDQKVVVLAGKPGVGKTSAALALAADRGWSVVEMNASESRNYDAIMKVAYQGSMFQTFAEDGSFLSSKSGGRKLIILDEADNLFGRDDKGGGKAIGKLIRDTRQPVMIIANDLQELKSKSSEIQRSAIVIAVPSPQKATIKKRIMKIAVNEGITLPEDVAERIAEKNHGDMRGAVNDLQAVCMGRDEVHTEDLDLLGDRDIQEKMFDFVGRIFKGESIDEARAALRSVDERPDFMLLWLEQNVPLAYKRERELAAALDDLSLADFYLGRATMMQYYGFWRYAFDLMGPGVTTAKRDRPRGYIRYEFPTFLKQMSRTKKVRNLRNGVSTSLGHALHASSRTTENDFLPEFVYLFCQDEGFRRNAVIELSLDTDDVGYLFSYALDDVHIKSLLARSWTMFTDRGRPDIGQVTEILKMRASAKEVKRLVQESSDDRVTVRMTGEDASGDDAPSLPDGSPAGSATAPLYVSEKDIPPPGTTSLAAFGPAEDDPGGSGSTDEEPATTENMVEEGTVSTEIDTKGDGDKAPRPTDVKQKTLWDF